MKKKTIKKIMLFKLIHLNNKAAQKRNRNKMERH
jgi:hypothetical protein